MQIIATMQKMSNSCSTAYDPTCAWCIPEAAALGIVLPEVISHDICRRHGLEQLARLAERKQRLQKGARTA